MTEVPKKYNDWGPEVAPQHVGLEVQHQPSSLEAYAVHNPHPTQQQWAYYSPTYRNEGVLPPKQILGLQRQTFWFIVVLVIVVIAAAVGGGVGGSIAVQNAKSKSQEQGQAFSVVTVTSTPTQSIGPSTASSATPTVIATIPTTSSTFTPPPAASVTRVSVACPSSTILSSWAGSAYFKCTDSVDLRDGDLTGIVAYSLQSCIDACATMNKVAGKRRCIAVSVGAELSQQYRDNSGANCWIKGNGTRPITSDVFSAAVMCVTPDCNELIEGADPP